MIKNFLDHKKAMLFDLDGTLVDSMWMWEAIDIEFLGAYGYECPEDLQRAIEGMSFSETAVYFKERFKLPLSLDEIKAISVQKLRHTRLQRDLIAVLVDRHLNPDCLDLVQA